MKYTIIYVALVTMILASCKSKNTSERIIKIEVQSTRDYCGGAKPPEELIKELRTPKDFNGMLYVNTPRGRENTQDIKVEVKDGKANIVGLKNGEYYVFSSSFVDVNKLLQELDTNEQLQKEYAQIDVECMRAENHVPIAQFEVDDKTKTVKLAAHIKCDPCIPPAP